MSSLFGAWIRQRSLGRRVVFAAAVQALLLLGVMVLVLRLMMMADVDVDDAATTYIEEQAIANRITAAVTHQLVAGVAAPSRPGMDVQAAFQQAGEEAYEHIRAYLFRPLSTAQRRQLEAVREQHQRMEVAAARAMELVERGEPEAASEGIDAMILHGFTLQTAVADFLRMREADLARLQHRQATSFRHLQAIVVLAALLMLLAAAVMARFLYLRLALPLSELATAASRIGDGDLGVRVERPAEADLAAVGDAFNQMVDRLAATRDALEERNRTTEHALRQLKTAQAELVQSEKLGAVGRMMAGLAHELNNPLASVLGYAELARARAADPEPVAAAELAEEYLTPIVAEAERARRLVHDLLRFARRSADATSAVPVAEALDMAVRLQRHAFEQAGLELRMESVPAVHVRGETQRLQQSFLDIIQNAYDAMRQQGAGALAIHGRIVGDTVVIRFEDDGPGFADVDQVFEPFYTTKPVGAGTGLGLALVHGMVEQVGGAIVAENRRSGGARFILTLRLADPPAASEADRGDMAKDPGAPTAPAGSVARVLVVEDEAPLRALQARLLGRLGITALLAEDGEAARAVLEREPVDLIVSDVKMPGGGGLALFRWVEQHRPDLQDRFLFVTGDTGDPDIAALAEQQPDRFIRKPFTMNDYMARIARELRGPAVAQ